MGKEKNFLDFVLANEERRKNEDDDDGVSFLDIVLAQYAPKIAKDGL